MAFAATPIACRGSGGGASAADVVELPCDACIFISARRDAAERRHAAHHGVGYAACGRRLVPGAGPAGGGLVSLLAGRLIGKVGIGAVAATGAALYAVGIVIWLCTIGTTPHYFTDYFPAQLFTGTGVGLVMPSLSAVTGVALPASRWGAGSAVTNTARQMGMVLGTTALTMIYQRGVDLAAIRHGWVFIVAAAAHGCAHRRGAGHLLERDRCQCRLRRCLNPRWRPEPRSAARRRLLGRG